MLNVAESGHPIFRAASALERVELKSKGKGNKSINFNGSDETIELILRTIISGNQLRIHGAVDLCEELARDSSSAGKPATNDNLGSMPTEFLTANNIFQTDADVQGNLLREYERPNSSPTLVLEEYWQNSSVHLMKKDL